MPVIFQERIASPVAVCVWEITETEEALLFGLQLSEADQLKIRNKKDPAKRRETIACRRALASLLQTNRLDIRYTATGQPLLEGWHVSFSHTGNYAAAVVSQHLEVGIDLEKIDTRILKLYSKFMSEKEIAGNDITDPIALHYYWGAKEALFKLYGKGNVLFAENLIVEKPESFREGNATGYLSFRSKVEVQLVNRVIRDMMLVVGYRF